MGSQGVGHLCSHFLLTGRPPSLIPGPSLTPPAPRPPGQQSPWGPSGNLLLPAGYLAHWIYQLPNCGASLTCFQIHTSSVWLRVQNKRQISTLPTCLRSHLTLRCLISVRSSVIQFSSSGGVLRDIACRDGRVHDFLLPSKRVLAEIGTLRARVGAWRKRVSCLPTPLSESASLGRHSRICISAKIPGVADRLPVGAPHPLEPLSRTSSSHFS